MTSIEVMCNATPSWSRASNASLPQKSPQKQSRVVAHILRVMKRILEGVLELLCKLREVLLHLTKSTLSFATSVNICLIDA